MSNIDHSLVKYHLSCFDHLNTQCIHTFFWTYKYLNFCYQNPILNKILTHLQIITNFNWKWLLTYLFLQFIKYWFCVFKLKIFRTNSLSWKYLTILPFTSKKVCKKTPKNFLFLTESNLTFIKTCEIVFWQINSILYTILVFKLLNIF